MYYYHLLSLLLLMMTSCYYITVFNVRFSMAPQVRLPTSADGAGPAGIWSHPVAVHRVAAG